VIFVSMPNAYRPVGPWWRPANSAEPVSFALTREQSSTELTFIHASDTHISPASLARTQRLRALVDSIRPGLLLITGDLVRDALRVGEEEATGYYELFARERNAFRTPVFTVPGNHENFGIERDTSHVPATHPLYGRGMYHHYFGPDYYSFTRGGVHFVGLNTVDIDDQRYYGHVDSLQIAWLERDLALVPADMPVVTFDHIPFVTTFEGLNGYNDRPPAPSLITVRGKTVYRHTVSNAGDVLAVLRKHRYVLALGGHLHATERIEYEMTGVRTRFNQISAVVGDSRGAGLESISGVTLYRVKNGEIDAGRFIPLEPAK
jgi:3',5'-cyclic AMP phosphodiesterase CpdA